MRSVLLLTFDLSELLKTATDDEDAIIRRVAYKAGVLWKCRNADCRSDMPRTAPRCSECGYDRAGRPIGDRVPTAYGPVPEELLTTLRRALAEWFTEHNRPHPDAVTFTSHLLDGTPCWSDWGDLHYGGRTEPGCAFDGTDVADVLAELDEWEAPRWGDDLTIALHR